MVETTVVNKLKEVFGGNVYVEQGKYRPLYRWHVRNFDLIVDIVNKVMPYLMVKREAASLLLEFIQGREQTEARLMTDDEVERRKAIYYKLKSTNAVGKLYVTIKEK